MKDILPEPHEDRYEVASASSASEGSKKPKIKMMRARTDQSEEDVEKMIEM